MNKLNWPTAFVIVAIIFAGAFVYNIPTGAIGSNSSQNGMIVLDPNYMNVIWQSWGSKLRKCSQAKCDY